MKFEAAKCPNCNGELQLPRDRVSAKCLYCGADIVVREAIHGAAVTNVDNLLKLADAASSAGNSEEAYNYYTKVLEFDSTNHLAWFGKALAAGSYSSLANLRLSETVNGLMKAIEYGPPNETSDLQRSAAYEMAILGDAIYQNCEAHLYEYVSLESSWPDFLRQGGEILDFLKIAHDLDPQNRSVMESIVTICQRTIQGIPYLDEYDTTEDGTPKRKAWRISQQYETDLCAVMTKFVTKLEQLDPTYRAPTIKKAWATSRCFVATATMGNLNHPYCVTLRRFRDNVLENYSVGRWFIAIYYRCAPPAANAIARSTVLKNLSRVLLIRPLVVICDCVERLTRRS